MIMVIKRVEYGISYYDLIKENFHAQIYPFSPVQGVPYHWAHFVFVIFSGSRASIYL